jgi:serine-type D-Ala-D-Ala carboxypeptidase (penicillin-binding protein 5/6)
MITSSVLRSALSGTVALAAGLLVLLSPPLPAARGATVAGTHSGAGAPGSRAVHGPPVIRAAAASPSPVSPANSKLLHRPGVQVRPSPGTPAPPDEVSALSWLVADARTGNVLAARDAHRRLPPASTLKTLFAVTALPHLPEHAEHLVTESELAGIGAGSSLVGVVPGQRYEVADLWRGVFLSSGNDAVRVLAEMNGGWDSTVAQMREKAKQLGALDTHVVSPDGYDAPGQVSSAYDLAVFGRTGVASAEFVRYSSTRDAQFPGDGSSFGIMNTNRLLSGADGVEPYPGLIGVKNGYTSEAGNTLIAAARRGGRTLLVTLMNPQSGGGHAVYEEARSLLDWGFDSGGGVAPVGSLQPHEPARAGREPDDAVARAVRATPGTSPAPAGHAGAERADGTRAGAAGSGPGYVLPAVAFTGAACLMAIGFLLARRTAR